MNRLFFVSIALVTLCAGVGLEDYVDYSVSLGASMGRFSLELAYSDTDYDALGALADERVVFQ